MRYLVRFAVVAALLAGCAASPKPPRKTIDQLYQDAVAQHFAGSDRWAKGVEANLRCMKLASAEAQSCFNQLPPPETYLPADRRKDETFRQYIDRKYDEWQEKDCFYKGVMLARHVSEAQRIEEQCKTQLEIKRLRKAVEQLQQDPKAK